VTGFSGADSIEVLEIKRSALGKNCVGWSTYLIRFAEELCANVGGDTAKNTSSGSVPKIHREGVVWMLSAGTFEHVMAEAWCVILFTHARLVRGNGHFLKNIPSSPGRTPVQCRPTGALGLQSRRKYSVSGR